MNLIKSILLCLFCLSLFTLTAQDKALPDVTVKTLEGKTVNMQEFGQSGKIIVISFWATWCAPCKNELDIIADVYSDWQDDYDMELVAVSIDTKRSVGKIPALVASKGWEYIVLSGDHTELQNAFGFQTIPQTFLVNQEGKIIYHHNGYVPGDEYELENKIKALAKKK